MTWLWIVIGVIAFVIIIAAIGYPVLRRARTNRLKGQFGPEYDRTAEAADSRRGAESELRDRERRRERLDIRPLPPETRQQYAHEWQAVQARFVDQPPTALLEADGLVQRVMRDRGYPVEDFEQRAADVSVDHPDVVQHYRTAHRISESTGRGAADTEEQRQAMVAYRALFDELLRDEEPQRPPQGEPNRADRSPPSPGRDAPGHDAAGQG